MTDIFSKAKRSDIMSHIRAKNTVAEMIVFRDLRKRRIYFQKHYARIVGTPDIALPRKKLAVFIDGDFWHGRTLVQSRSRRGDNVDDFWIRKIMRNVERDKSQENYLKDNGWRFMRVWDSDIRGSLQGSGRLMKLQHLSSKARHSTCEL